MKPLKSILLLFALAFAAPVMAQQAPAHVRAITNTNGTAAPTVAEAVDVTFGPDVSGSLNSTWFKFYDALDAHCYYVWFNINSAGVDPAVSNCTGIVVAGATNDTAATLAGTARTNVGASGAATYVTVSGATTHLILTNNSKGAATDWTDGTAPTGFSASKTQGVSSTLAIATVDAGILGWKICNNGTNTSTWLAVGQAKDTETDGVRLKKGACLSCPNCSQRSLQAERVSAQAASNGYSVIQYK